MYVAVMTSQQQTGKKFDSPEWMDVSLGPSSPEEESTPDETPTLVTGTSRSTEDTPTDRAGETETEPIVQPPRRSTRVRQPPDRFGA